METGAVGSCGRWSLQLMIALLGGAVPLKAESAGSLLVPVGVIFGAVEDERKVVIET